MVRMDDDHDNHDHNDKHVGQVCISENSVNIGTQGTMWRNV